MKTEDKERSERVIKVFKESNLNQRQFAELIGVSQQLVSAVVNFTKKPNETILLAILDNIEGIDPLWLFTGIGKQQNNYIPIKKEVVESQSPIENHIKKLVQEQFGELSEDIIQRLSSIEDSIKGSN